jgi:hypothetical protein
MEVVDTVGHRLFLLSQQMFQDPKSITFFAFVFDFEQGNFPIVIDEADNHEVNSKQLVNVTCLPLYSILMALDNPSIGLYLLFLVKIFV